MLIFKENQKIFEIMEIARKNFVKTKKLNVFPGES